MIAIDHLPEGVILILQYAVLFRHIDQRQIVPMAHERWNVPINAECPGKDKISRNIVDFWGEIIGIMQEKLF